MILTGRFRFKLRLLPLGLLFTIFAQAADQHWLRVSSDHFVVLTDANQKKGHEISAHFEQMRAIFAQLLMRKQVRMGEPIEILALADPAKYSQLAPSVNGQPINRAGFYISGEDRVFIVLNAADPDSWRAVEHPLAHYFLNYNYPPTQPWFDEGFAEYFASLNLTAQAVELGGDPGVTPPTSNLKTGQAQNASPVTSAVEKPLADILDRSPWLTLTDLLQSKPRDGVGDERPDTIFAAQSWILVHYLISQDKLSETGTYFGLVELQKVPVAQAVEQAFEMPPTQLDSALKQYFQTLKPVLAARRETRVMNKAGAGAQRNQSPLPFSIDEVSTTANSVALAEAMALVDEMELRIPERRAQAT
ncbi:MAG TPA: hypothetical protein VGU90_11145, partial [Terriglobales bacterium]|nr:hypothetical protein [Terriglobales bacterium]